MSIALKSKLVGTGLGEAAIALRDVVGLRGVVMHPELLNIYLEPRRVRWAVKRLLKPNFCCVDVGAHIGSFTALLWRRCPHGRIIAFEPSPQKVKLLANKFRGVEVVQAAVADYSGVAEFCDDQIRSGYSRLAGNSPIPNSKTYSVRTVTLDETISGPVDFIKIDTEGAELLAMRGATRILSTTRPALLFECGPEREYPENRRGIFELLSGLGYSIFAPFNLSNPLSFDGFMKCGVYPFTAFNFIARHAASQ